MNLRLTLAAIAISLVLGLAGACWLLSSQLSNARAERDAAVAELFQTRLAFTELSIERAAADRRAELVRDAREGILLSPAEDDGPVARALWLGLRAADQIGGIQ